MLFGPRPCGRGGFKHTSALAIRLSSCPRPCGRGGFKPLNDVVDPPADRVPAHAGGVDLSNIPDPLTWVASCPRPCGRGGFKQYDKTNRKKIEESPPMRAGWI